MIGEIRDAETAEIAVKAAQTGHGAVDAAYQLHRRNPDAANAHGYPRLPARRLPEAGHRTAAGAQAVSPLPLPAQPADAFSCLGLAGAADRWRADGCEHCFGGYYGRIGVYELLAITPEIQAALLTNTAPSLLADVAREQGQLSLLQAGLALASEGTTSLEELYRVIDVVQLGVTAP